MVEACVIDETRLRYFNRLLCALNGADLSFHDHGHVSRLTGELLDHFLSSLNRGHLVSNYGGHVDNLVLGLHLWSGLRDFGRIRLLFPHVDVDDVLHNTPLDSLLRR